MERQIAPVLSGVYSGKLNELTMASTLPYLLDYKISMEVLLKVLKRIKQFQSAGNKNSYHLKVDYLR